MLHATVLKFHIHIPDENIADSYFNVLAMSYDPLKIVCKISQKVFEL